VRPWSGDRYDALRLPHEQWGQRVVDTLELTGDELVADVGCGTGRDLSLLLDLLPAGRVVAVDASASMLERVHERFADDRRVTVVQADLHDPIPLPSGAFDAVMSVAALHWLRDHDTIWDRLATLLRPGGQLAVECGGAGNIARVVSAVEQVSGKAAVPRWTFAGAEETAERVRAAGLVDVEVVERASPVRFPAAARLVDYLQTLALHDLPRPVLNQVADVMSDLTVDYVRLEVRARRGR